MIKQQNIVKLSTSRNCYLLLNAHLKSKASFNCLIICMYDNLLTVFITSVHRVLKNCIVTALKNVPSLAFFWGNVESTGYPTICRAVIETILCLSSNKNMQVWLKLTKRLTIFTIDRYFYKVWNVEYLGHCFLTFFILWHICLHNPCRTPNQILPCIMFSLKLKSRFFISR